VNTHQFDVKKHSQRNGSVVNVQTMIARAHKGGQH